jgi:acyl-CoA thioesterase YciA
VFLGDIVSFYTETTRVGRTSITVKVLVEVERWSAGQGERIKVTEAEVVLVAVGQDGQPTPIAQGSASAGPGRDRVEGGGGPAKP